MNDEELVAELTERLGLPAGSLKPELALQALRHGSYVGEKLREPMRSNERLEFLGDAVLGFLIAQRFYDLFPDAPEGDLTRLRASVVREESLAIVGRQLGLGELLLLGRGEQRTGGRENAGRLADGLEAVLGAVFLSCGLERTREMVERVLAPLFEQSGALSRDPKTELQQLFQSRRRVPQYLVLAATGPPHARSYEVEIRLDETPLGRGTGRSKKEAEQAAARSALENPDAVERALIDEPVALEAADPRWAGLALEEMAKIRGALPHAHLEHIGSTAVPGLDSKPIIDILAGVPDLAAHWRVPDYEACGEAGVPGRLYFRKRNAASFNLQIVLHGGPLWNDALLLRDYLRAHPEKAALYAAAKRAAVAAGATTLLQYSRQKAPLLKDFFRDARAWTQG